MRDYPKIMTPPPGPKAKAIVDKDSKYTSTCYLKEYPLAIATGRGAMVEDVDGNKYLDFMAGIAVSSTGYNHPKVVAAVQEQAGKFLHICGSDFYFEGMANLCERLARLASYFRNGDAKVELVQSYASGDLVVLAVIEREHGEVGGLPDQDWSLRVTLVYRRQGTEWWLVHRHADPLVRHVELETAAALARGANLDRR